MIFASLDLNTAVLQEITAHNASQLTKAVWIDLLSPSKEEIDLVDQCLGIEIPTLDEMQEIEFSSRLYKEDGNLFMTATLIAQSDSADPRHDPVTFILTPEHLLTIRYIQPQSFKVVTSRLQKLDPEQQNPIEIFIELLDATIAPLADTLELVGKRLNECSVTIFRPQEDNRTIKVDYRRFMQKLGNNGDLTSKARDSLTSLSRLISYFSQTCSAKLNSEAAHQRLTTFNTDIASLSDHANFLSIKVNFILDATLGLINIDQNNIIKIFSVAAVIFLPPTLIASIYGMNFHFIPELTWKYGYFFAVGLMLFSAWLPYKYFKRKKWL